MRPVTKANVGDTIVLENGLPHTIVVDYIPYQTAKPALIANLGSYCSYCEVAIPVERDIAVEHIQPKGLPKYSTLETRWSNFLLGCSTCNGRDNKDTKDVVLADCHLPNRNNTFKSLEYKAGGVVTVNPILSSESKAHAQALLELVGLDKSPATSSPTDTRWRRRLNDWNLAKRYHNKYLCHCVDEDVIIDLVMSRGGWSIWFTVFKGSDAVRERLINCFPGTCSSCFDCNNHYEPIDRNPGQTDPV